MSIITSDFYANVVCKYPTNIHCINSGLKHRVVFLRTMNTNTFIQDMVRGKNVSQVPSRYGDILSPQGASDETPGSDYIINITPSNHNSPNRYPDTPSSYQETTLENDNTPKFSEDTPLPNKTDQQNIGDISLLDKLKYIDLSRDAYITHDIGQRVQKIVDEHSVKNNKRTKRKGDKKNRHKREDERVRETHRDGKGVVQVKYKKTDIPKHIERDDHRKESSDETPTGRSDKNYDGLDGRDDDRTDEIPYTNSAHSTPNVNRDIVWVLQESLDESDELLSVIDACKRMLQPMFANPHERIVNAIKNILGINRCILNKEQIQDIQQCIHMQKTNKDKHLIVTVSDMLDVAKKLWIKKHRVMQMINEQGILSNDVLDKWRQYLLCTEADIKHISDIVCVLQSNDSGMWV